MAWACANGHRVREGMFVCPCGSADIRDRAGPTTQLTDAEAAVAHDAAVEKAAEDDPNSRLRSTIFVGVALVALGLNVGPDGPPSELFEPDWTAIVALISFLAGVAFVLTGIIGYGVKLGLEASGRADR